MYDRTDPKGDEQKRAEHQGHAIVVEYEAQLQPVRADSQAATCQVIGWKPVIRQHPSHPSQGSKENGCKTEETANTGSNATYEFYSLRLRPYPPLWPDEIVTRQSYLARTYVIDASWRTSPFSSSITSVADTSAIGSPLCRHSSSA